MAARSRAGTARREQALLAVLVAVCLAFAACGSDSPSDREAIRGAVTDLQRALAEGDLEGACDLMTEDAQIHVGEAAHDPPTSCGKDLVLVYDMLRRGSGLREATHRRVVALKVDGDRAVARLAATDPGGVVDVPLARDGDSWKVDALYGAVPAARQEDNFD